MKFMLSTHKPLAMRPSFSNVISVFTVSRLLSCDLHTIGPYYNLGNFTNRTITEQKALAYLADRYDKLPANDYKKVKYTVEQPKQNTSVQHAIWYSNVNQQLSLEVDLSSGTCSSWTGVSQAVLNQIVQSNKGLSIADLLSKSNGTSCISCIEN